MSYHKITSTISGEEAHVSVTATPDRIRGHLVALVKPKNEEDETACVSLSEAMANNDIIQALPHARALCVIIETKG